MHLAHKECSRNQTAFLPFPLFQARQSELTFACPTSQWKGRQLLSRQPQKPQELSEEATPIEMCLMYKPEGLSCIPNTHVSKQTNKQVNK